MTRNLHQINFCLPFYNLAHVLFKFQISNLLEKHAYLAALRIDLWNLRDIFGLHSADLSIENCSYWSTFWYNPQKNNTDFKYFSRFI